MEFKDLTNGQCKHDRVAGGFAPGHRALVVAVSMHEYAMKGGGFCCEPKVEGGKGELQGTSQRGHSE